MKTKRQKNRSKDLFSPDFNKWVIGEWTSRVRVDGQSIYPIIRFLDRHRADTIKKS